nr:MAG TPA: hypothetical protein [Caudoviricetes sp.]
MAMRKPMTAASSSQFLAMRRLLRFRSSRRCRDG